MSGPTLSVVIPTPGRASLARTLDSIAPQMGPGDQVIVVGDTREGQLPPMEALCGRHPAGPLYVPFTDGLMSWGHHQIQYGLGFATGDYVLAQDDDDIYLPGAFDAIRAAASDNPGRVLLFRFRSQRLGGVVFWHTPGPEWIRQGHIGGHCLVQPNIPGKVGQLTARYEGDFDWIVDTLARHEEPPVWCDFIIAEQLPQEDR